MYVSASCVVGVCVSERERERKGEGVSHWGIVPLLSLPAPSEIIDTDRRLC